MTFTGGQRVTATELNGNTMQLITTATPSGVGSAVLTVTGSYSRLKLLWRARSDTAATATSLYVQFNADGGNNYLYEVNQANNSTVTGTTSGAAGARIQVGTIPAASATALYFGSGESLIDGVSDATNYKTVSGHGSAYTSTTNMYSGTYGGQWNSAAVVTAVTVFPSSGNFVSGSSLALYGLD